jgi:hypothetical protein
MAILSEGQTSPGLADRSQVRAHDQEYCRKIWHFAAPFGTHYFASNLHRRSIFLRESGAGLLGFAILGSNKVEWAAFH